MNRVNPISLHRRPSRLLGVGALVLVLSTLSSPLFAKSVGGVDLANAMTVGETETILVGAGIRKRLIFKLYVASLYSQNAHESAASLLAADEAMVIKIDVLSELLTRDKMVAALKDGFKNSTNNNTAPIASEIEQMMNLMQDKVVPGTTITLAYEPGKGTHIGRDGKYLDTIEGLPFKKPCMEFGYLINRHKPV